MKDNKLINFYILLFSILFTFFNNYQLHCKCDSIDYNFVDIKNRKYDIDYSNKTTHIILYNGISCAGCFTYLEDSLLKEDTNSIILVLIKTGEDSYSRRVAIQSLSKLIKCRNYYFETRFPSEADNIKRAQKDIFENFNILITPALLTIQNCSAKYYSFHELFNSKKINKLKE